MDSMLAGFISGSIQTLVGHPFDTLKVRLLSAPRPSSSFRHMYKGSGPALWSGCFSNSFVFGTEHHMHAFTSSYWQTGGLSGFLTSFVVHPLEYIKCRKQIHQKIEWDRMMKGIVWTVARDTIGYSIYFHAFHHYQPDMGTFTAGGMAGVFSWLFTYPLDVIKTRIQCGSEHPFNPHAIMKGLYIVLCRSFVVNALLFGSFDPLQKTIRQIVH